MKKHISRGIALAALAGLVLTTRAQDTTDQSQFPTILTQPVDQCLLMGVAATFSVEATNADTYQWYRNNLLMDGQTNSSLTIPNISTNDVGYYFAAVIKGSETVPTRQACLNVYITSAATSTSTTSSGPKNKFATQSMAMAPMDLGGGGTITVYGAPVTSGGSTGSCPGAYSGYVNYLKPVSQGWGFYSSTNTTIHTATDGNRTDTKVQYMGFNSDPGCSQTSVTVPDPTPSPKYRFSIFFPRGTSVPTNSYPITLIGFDP
jgi:hypothetical protein